MREILITKNTSGVFIKPNSNIVDKSLKYLLNRVSDLLVSVEISPNKSVNPDLLSTLSLSFCSVTWRTPSNEQLKNVEEIPAILLAKQLRNHGYNVLLHLAGRNLHTYEVVNILNSVKDAGIRNLFALQGDPSEIREKDDKKCDFPYAADLVKFIRSYYGNFFTIGVAGYPEAHPKSKNMEMDLEYLKQKVSCGADFIITQLSFDYGTFSNFSRQCRSAGIKIPIVPGIFIISSCRTLMAMSKFCGIPIPENILEIVEANKNNELAVKEYGIYLAEDLIRKLFENRELFGGVHVFSLNNLELLEEVLKRIGITSVIERPLVIDKQ